MAPLARTTSTKVIAGRRTRKFNHKTRFRITRGWEASQIVDEPLENGESRYEFDEAPLVAHANRALFVGGMGTSARGVDQEESQEVHLKEVLAAKGTPQPPKERSTFVLGRVDGRMSISPTLPPPSDSAPHTYTSSYIPTPAVNVVDPDLYSTLYPPPAYSPSFTLLRFSDTVEDSIRGALRYTMDEEDEDWLSAFNRRVEASPVAGASMGKVKERESRSTISENEFEMIMEAFEGAMDNEAVKSSEGDSLPSFEDLSAAFLRQPRFIGRPLPAIVESVYPHWKQRRAARDGEPIIPELDYDETHEGPYVCFRRRDVKLARKTRRSDQQNLDRLLATRNDLHAVLELMKRVRQREIMKLGDVLLDRAVFEKQVEVRELKRVLGEDRGDEELLIVPERKRRVVTLGSSGSRSRAATPTSASPSVTKAFNAPMVPIDQLRGRRTRAKAISTAIAQDGVDKLAADRGWEEATDTAFHTAPLDAPNRYWRATEPVAGAPRWRDEQREDEGGDSVWREYVGFEKGMVDAGARRGPYFRLRRGRGGRVMLDRAGLHRREGARVRVEGAQKGGDEECDGTVEEDEEAEEYRAWGRRLERLRYDDDLALHQLPELDEPAIIDDFALPYTLRRIKLLNWEEAEEPDCSYVQDAFQYLEQLDKEVFTPPTIVGRPQPPNAFKAVPMAPSASSAPAPTTASVMARAQLASDQARKLAFAQAHVERQKQQQQVQQQQTQAQTTSQLDRFSAMERLIAKAPAPNPDVSSYPSKASPANSSDYCIGTPSTYVNGSSLPPYPPGPAPAPQLPTPWMAANTPSLSSTPLGASGSIALPIGFAPPLHHVNGFGLPPASGAPYHSNGLLAAIPLPAVHAPAPIPLGANNLPATSRLAAPPYVNSEASSPVDPPMMFNGFDGSGEVGPRQQQPFSAFPPPVQGASTRRSSGSPQMETRVVYPAPMGGGGEGGGGS